MIWRPYLLIACLIMLSALFSGSEISYAGASRVKLRKAAEQSRGGSAGLAYKIASDFESALITILIGNNLVNMGASAMATVIAVALMGDSGAWAATIVMTVLIITFGEISPKILASKRPESFATAVARPLYALMVITKPIVASLRWLLKKLGGLWESSAIDESVTEDDLETIFETAEDEGVVDEDTADLLQRALSFDDVLAYTVITPRVDMEAIDIGDDEKEIIDRILATPFSRLPVYRDTPDNIIGICHVNQCLRSMAGGEKFDLRALMIKPAFVHKTMPLDHVFKTMQREDCHMVVVTDEYGGTMGILTMEDVLEQIVGEIWDEKDEIDEQFTEIEENLYEVDADMRIEDLFYELDMDDRDFEDDNATLGGWAIEMCGAYPQTGQSFSYKNLTFTVSEMDGMRVTALKIKVEPAPEEDEDM